LWEHLWPRADVLDDVKIFRELTPEIQSIAFFFSEVSDATIYLLSGFGWIIA
jgi:hypothetical protein